MGSRHFSGDAVARELLPLPDLTIDHRLGFCKMDMSAGGLMYSRESDRNMFYGVYLEDELTHNLPTPPNSTGTGLSPAADIVQDEASVSTAFNPETLFPPPYNYRTDMIVLSLPDSVFFHVHMNVLEQSNNYFASALVHFRESRDPVVRLLEPAPVLNCMFHALYGVSCRQYSPSIETLSSSFTALEKYGFCVAHIVTPESAVFQDLLQLAEAEPLEVYTLAASHLLESLAVPVSFYTLSTDITKIEDTMAEMMGPVYLLRLAVLHTTRKEELKKLMLVAPNVHEDTPTCNLEQRQMVMRAYALAAAYLAWEVRANADSEWIMSGLSPLLGRVSCALCEGNLRRRIHTVLDSWQQVKSTI